MGVVYSLRKTGNVPLVKMDDYIVVQQWSTKYLLIWKERKKFKLHPKKTCKSTFTVHVHSTLKSIFDSISDMLVPSCSERVNNDSRASTSSLPITGADGPSVQCEEAWSRGVAINIKGRDDRCEVKLEVNSATSAAKNETK